MNTRSDNETFEKCSNSFKFKEDEKFNGGIYGIFRGLNFEADAEIGRKGAFFKGFTISKTGGYRYGGCISG